MPFLVGGKARELGTLPWFKRSRQNTLTHVLEQPRRRTGYSCIMNTTSGQRKLQFLLRCEIVCRFWSRVNRSPKLPMQKELVQCQKKKCEKSDTNAYIAFHRVINNSNNYSAQLIGFLCCPSSLHLIKDTAERIGFFSTLLPYIFEFG